MSESSSEDSSPTPATVFERMLAAGLSEQRAREHLDASRVQVAGVEVDEPDYPGAAPDALDALGPLTPDDPSGRACGVVVLSSRGGPRPSS